MNTQYMTLSYNFSEMMAQDVGTPELRKPNVYSAKKTGKIHRILRRVFSTFGA